MNVTFCLGRVQPNTRAKDLPCLDESSGGDLPERNLTLESSSEDLPDTNKKKKMADF